MKYLVLAVEILLINACGGDSEVESRLVGAPNDEPQEALNCSVVNDTITLNDGESCSISSATASTYSVNGGLLSCNSTVLTYGSSTFQANGSGATFNGLTLICQG